MNPLASQAAVKMVALAVLAACVGVGAALVVGNEACGRSERLRASGGSWRLVPLQRP